MFRFIFFLLLLASAQLSFGVAQQIEPIKMVFLSESQKLKLEEKKKQEEDHNLLVAAYDKLSDAITADDLPAVKMLFNEHPRLRSYAHHNEGTPLHFARSQTMAQFLVERIGFDTNVCDEWGELPSKTILATKDMFFTAHQEKALIAKYLASRETRFSKIYYQCKNNKNIHRKAALTATTILLLALDYYLLRVGLNATTAVS